MMEVKNQTNNIVLNTHVCIVIQFRCGTASWKFICFVLGSEIGANIWKCHEHIQHYSASAEECPHLDFLSSEFSAAFC